MGNRPPPFDRRPVRAGAYHIVDVYTSSICREIDCQLVLVRSRMYAAQPYMVYAACGKAHFMRRRIAV